MRAIGTMFTAWKALFKSKMKNEDWGIDTVEIWTVALTEMAITPSEFLLAHKKSLSLPWQPTTPADFISLVRKDQLNDYPNSRLAFQIACKNEGMTNDLKQVYEHIVIYETVKRLSSYSLKNADESYFKIWDEMYQKVLHEHRNGAKFSLNTQQQIQYKNTEVISTERAQEFIDKIKKIIGKKI